MLLWVVLIRMILMVLPMRLLTMSSMLQHITGYIGVPRGGRGRGLVMGIWGWMVIAGCRWTEMKQHCNKNDKRTKVPKYSHMVGVPIVYRMECNRQWNNSKYRSNKPEFTLIPLLQDGLHGLKKYYADSMNVWMKKILMEREWWMIAVMKLTLLQVH